MIQLTRKLSQVFLKDIRYIKKIIEAMPLSQRTVVEIGPGSGRMTEHIAPLVKQMHCVEIDTRLVGFLREKFSSAKNVDIIEMDIRKYVLPQNEQPLIVFGNIPYAISKDVVEYLVKNRGNVEQAYLTCQKEFISKLVTKPGSEFYGFLSCFIQYFAEVERLFDIPASAFSPRPKVDSSFAAITFYSTTEFDKDDEGFILFLRKIFSYPRKQIAGILRDINIDIHILDTCAIDHKSRPGDIALEQYCKLYAQTVSV